MAVAYPTLGTVMLALFVGPGWIVPEARPRVAHVLAVEVPVVDVRVSSMGIVFIGIVVAVILAMLLLIGMTSLRDRERGATPFVGATLLAIAMLNDGLGIGLGLYDTIVVAPFGFVLFVYAMSLALIDRYVLFASVLSERSDELAQRTTQLARSLEELEQTQQELLQREQLAMVGELAAVITHEVRNPMAIVQNAVVGLRGGGAASDDTRGLLGIIEDEMSRLDRLVTNLLVLARPVAPQRTPFDVQTLIDKSLIVVDAHPQVDVSFDTTGPWPSIEVDVELMHQVLSNVFLNAVEAMDGYGELRIEVSGTRLDGRA
ncbi:MAG: histidine kinase dimerization/phospho-acceptor domain-containing protein, partial [Polyangiaceae bacterium]